MEVFIAITILFALLAVGLPVAFAMAVSGSMGLLMIGGIDLLAGILRTAPFTVANSYEIITIPMFILMAEFVILSGMADDLFKAASIWIGRVKGGLAIATALAGAGFGAISGSSTAAAATLSSTTIPAMLKQGYEPRLACGVVATSGTLAMMIPPSIALVLYGIIADVSIGKLLIAGVIPGILVTFTIMMTVSFLVMHDPSRAPVGRAYSMIEKLRSLKVVGPMIFLFAAVTGSIYLGIATPTEAAGLGAFGALVLAAYTRRVSLITLKKALKQASQATCMILLIILAAQIFGYFFALTRTTQDIVLAVGELETSRWAILALILLGYIILGFFMDQIAILILTVPVALPVIQSLGYDPVWFGVIVVLAAEVGMVTPPMGLNTFVVARYSQRSLGEIFRGVIPFVIAFLVMISVLAVFPELVLWLPETMGR